MTAQHLKNKCTLEVITRTYTDIFVNTVLTHTHTLLKYLHRRVHAPHTQVHRHIHPGQMHTLTINPLILVMVVMEMMSIWLWLWLLIYR